MATSNNAQEDAPVTPEATYVDTKTPLLDRAPFDLIVLDEENKGFTAEVQTLSSLKRPRLQEADRKGKLQFRFLYDDAFLYEVEWIHVAKVEFFENMLFAKAQELVVQAKSLDPAKEFVRVEGLLDEAYRYFSRLQTEYPKYPGLEAAVDEFLYQDAGSLYKAGRFAESLSVMDQLNDRN
ncbi:MAG TPA: hypothetical protein P5307_20795, partial [Pirellulaceae bacterium]|nr:hypothetical protein [Pirellulaceae bacterium]